MRSDKYFITKQKNFLYKLILYVVTSLLIVLQTSIFEEIFERSI